VRLLMLLSFAASALSACSYYRKRGKLRTALNYCRKALGIESRLAENVKSADTHLNMCTILSELKRHEKAIVHARIALKLLLLELFGNMQTEQQQQQQQQQEQQQQDQQQQQSAAEHEAIATGAAAPNASDPASLERLRSRLPADRVAVLAIAYHNKAVQEEFLRRSSEALASYEKATKVVTTHLGKDHPLVASLQESYRAAHKKMESKQQQQQQQQAQGAQGGQQSQTNKVRSTSAGATLSKSKSTASHAKLPATHTKTGSKGSKATASSAAAAPASEEQPLSDGEYDGTTGAAEDGGFASE
jgi:hypothetical protein